MYFAANPANYARKGLASPFAAFWTTSAYVFRFGNRRRAFSLRKDGVDSSRTAFYFPSASTSAITSETNS